jgi:hypothetical protein
MAAMCCTLRAMSTPGATGGTSDDASVHALRARLEHGEASAGEAVTLAAGWAVGAATRAARLAACNLLGDLAGRALGAVWERCSRRRDSPTPPPTGAA